MHNNHPSVPRFENVSLQDSYVLDIAVHPGLQSVVKAAVDASGSADYGSIDALTALDEDSYKILGDWGEIIVQSEAPSMSIDPTHID
ncbi:hypothetical protein ACJ7VE_06975 [Streptomyces sp. PB17]|uniref:hypothetical protein n=1 Tax=Streptomyces sp. PB17 TaxID=3384158 RepID=UPI0038B5DCF4